MGVLFSGSVANTKYCRVSLSTEYYLTSACASLRLTNLQAYCTHRSHNPQNILECSRFPILLYTEVDSSPWDRDLVRPTAVDHHQSGNYMSSQAAPHQMVAFKGQINSEFNIAWEQATFFLGGLLVMAGDKNGNSEATAIPCNFDAFYFNLSPPYQ